MGCPGITQYAKNLHFVLLLFDTGPKTESKKSGQSDQPDFAFFAFYYMALSG